jgi:hypothetical protein
MGLAGGCPHLQSLLRRMELIMVLGLLPNLVRTLEPMVLGLLLRLPLRLG